MPVRNYFPQFYKLKSGAYSYIWTEKCERLLPKHYKARCLEYMLKEPTPVHYIPDDRKYKYDKHGTSSVSSCQVIYKDFSNDMSHDRIGQEWNELFQTVEFTIPVQNHPIHVRYPDQCNLGLWAGEGIVMCYLKKVEDKTKDRYNVKYPKVYAPFLVKRSLYSEILDKWFTLPCTNRAMDLIDEAFGLDNYILKNHERDINSKIGMDIKRHMLIALAKGDIHPNNPEKREKLMKKFKDYIIPLEEAEWVGLSIKEALEKAEKEKNAKRVPLKVLIEEKFIQDLQDMSPYESQEKDVVTTQGKESSKQEGTAV